MRTGVPFIVHDGTAGMLFDPRVWDGGGAIQAGTEEVRDTGGWMRLWSWFSLLPFFLNRILGAWRKKELGGFGSVLRQWNQGNFRWQVTGIGVGDPVYLLGNVVPRTAEDLAANGTHPTAQSALPDHDPVQGWGGEPIPVPSRYGIDPPRRHAIDDGIDHHPVHRAHLQHRDVRQLRVTSRDRTLLGVTFALKPC